MVALEGFFLLVKSPSLTKICLCLPVIDRNEDSEAGMSKIEGKKKDCADNDNPAKCDLWSGLVALAYHDEER